MNVLSSSISQRVESYFPNVALDQLYGPDMQKTHHFGLRRLDNNTYFGPAVRDSFTMHTKDDVLALAEAVVPIFGDISDVQMGWTNGHFLSIQPEKELVIEATDNDSVFPRVIITAEYGRAFTATLGMYRSLCKNLSMFRSLSKFIVRMRHTSGLRSKMADLIEDFHILAQGRDQLELTIKQMVNREVQLAEFLADIYPTPNESASDKSKTMHARRMGKIIRRIQNERATLGVRNPDLHTVTGWEAYNAVQGYIQHDARRRGNPGTFDRAIKSLADPKVAHAQHLALTM